MGTYTHLVQISENSPDTGNRSDIQLSTFLFEYIRFFVRESPSTLFDDTENFCLFVSMFILHLRPTWKMTARYLNDSDHSMLLCASFILSSPHEQVAQLWQRDRASSIDNLKGWVNLRLNFRLKVTSRAIMTLRLLTQCLLLRSHISGDQISHFTASKNPFMSYFISGANSVPTA